MGSYYYIVNTTKRQFFYPGYLFSDVKIWDLLNGIAGHALALLILDQVPNKIYGLWAGDALHAVADEQLESVVHKLSTTPHPPGTEACEIFKAEYTDITPAIVAVLCEAKPAMFMDVAENDDQLFVNLVHLFERFDLPLLRHAFHDCFGAQWRRHYNMRMKSLGTRQVWDLEAVRDILPAHVPHDGDGKT